MDLQIVRTIGTTEPITLEELKNYIRIKNNRDDDLLTNIITVARARAERFLNRDILAKERKLYLQNVDQPFNLPYAPVTSVDAVTVDGESQTEDTDYEVLGFDDPQISFSLYHSDSFARGLDGNFIPTRKVEVTYTTSGLEADDIRLGLLSLAASMYPATPEGVPKNWKSFLSPFKITRYYGTR